MAPVDFGFRVYVSQGELATLMGTVAFGKMLLRLEGGMMGEDGQAIAKALNRNTGVYLDNPEIRYGLIPAMVTHGVVAQETADTVEAFIVQQLAAPPEVSPGIPAPARYRWRLPAGTVASLWFTGGAIYTEPSLDGYVRVWTDLDSCSHPDAVREV